MTITTIVTISSEGYTHKSILTFNDQCILHVHAKWYGNGRRDLHCKSLRYDLNIYGDVEMLLNTVKYKASCKIVTIFCEDSEGKNSS